MAAIEDELTCCVCLDMFKDPVILTCSHNLCRTCAMQLTRVTGQHTPMTIICPHCRSMTPIETVRQNRTLANIVAVFKTQKKTQEMSEMTASGDRPVMPHSSSGACEEYCNLHAGHLVEVFCETCSRMACDMCVCMKPMEHRSPKHKIVKIDELKEKYVKQIHDLEILRDELIAKTLSIKDDQSAVQASCLRALAESGAGVRQMEKLLQQRWKVLHQEYTTHVGHITAKYDRSLNQIQALQSQTAELLAPLEDKTAELQTRSLLNLHNGTMSLSRFLSKASSVLEAVQVSNVNVASATKSRVLNFDLLSDVINGLSWSENETSTTQGATAVGAVSSQPELRFSKFFGNGANLLRLNRPDTTYNSCVSTTGSSSLQPTPTIRSSTLRSTPVIIRDAHFTYPSSTTVEQTTEQKQPAAPATLCASHSMGARPKAVPSRPLVPFFTIISSSQPTPPACSVVVQESTPNHQPTAVEGQSSFSVMATQPSAAESQQRASKRQTVVASCFASPVATTTSAYSAFVPSSFQFVTCSQSSVSCPDLSSAAGASTTAPSFCATSTAATNGTSGVQSDASARPMSFSVSRHPWLNSWSFPATTCSVPSSAFATTGSSASSNRVQGTEPTAIFSLGKMPASTQTSDATTTTSTSGSSMFSLMPSFTSDWSQKFSSLFSSGLSSVSSDMRNRCSDSTTTGSTNAETGAVSEASASSSVTSEASFPATTELSSPSGEQDQANTAHRATTTDLQTAVAAVEEDPTSNDDGTSASRAVPLLPASSATSTATESTGSGLQCLTPTAAAPTDSPVPTTISSSFNPPNISPITFNFSIPSPSSNSSRNSSRRRTSHRL